MADYSYGDLIPNGTVLNDTLGAVDLTVQDNMFIAEGFYIKNTFGEKDLFSYENDSLGIIPQGASLVALNIHRNGPYGFPTFKQIRTSENPLTRYHNKNSIFSYVKDGTETATNGRQVFVPKYSNLTQIQESPIVSNNKPLTMVGGVSEYNRRTGKTSLERVEVQASPTNEIQFFGNKQANRDFGLDIDTHESYEDLTELYLDGGIESEDSPVDQFEILRYQHQIYPREQNSYLEHVRARSAYWEPGYWKDTKKERTEIGSIDNGFGFTVPSQSIWPLDVEDDWDVRGFNSTIGYFTMSSPSEFVYNNTKTSGDGFYLPNYADGTYLWSYSPVGSLTYNYDINTSEASFYGKLYGMNTRQVTQDFYDKWIELLEDIDLQIISKDAAINVRNNLNVSNVSYQDNDPFYMEIDNTAHSYIETELSHSYVHFWTKDENFIDGYVYREMDSNNTHKRSIQMNNDNLIVRQSTVFEIIGEDGASEYLTGSDDSSGYLLFRFIRNQYIPQFVGDEWNNKMIKFGDPRVDGDQSISFLSNGNEVVYDSLVDNLNFFDSNGDMRTGPSAYDDGTTSYAYRKTGPTVAKDGYLQSDAGSLQTIPNSNINIGFYYRTTRTDFSDIDSGGTGNNPHLHRILFIGTDNGQQTSYSLDTGVHVFLTARMSAPPNISFSPAIKVVVQETPTKWKEASFQINEKDLTKYLVVIKGSGTTQPYPQLYRWDDSDNTYIEVTSYEQNSTHSGVLAASLSSFRYIMLYDPNTYSTFNAAPSNGDELADIVFYGGQIPKLSTYFKGGATVDFTSPYWSSPTPFAWYRLGNGSNDNNASFTIGSGDFTYTQDYSGNSYDLYGYPNTTDIDITVSNEGPLRASRSSFGFHTSSVGEAYVLCATSSTNNERRDYFRNAKIAEFALIQSSSTTDLEDYIPLSSTPTEKQTLYI